MKIALHVTGMFVFGVAALLAVAAIVDRLLPTPRRVARRG